MGRAVEGGQHLEVRLALAGGISLGIAAAWLGAVSEGAVFGSHGGLLKQV
jgi:hypothetical protein